jgi:hypothetical protein
MTITTNGSGILTLTTNAAITEGQRVHVTSGRLAAVSGATDPSIGVATHAAESGGTLAIKLFTAPGTYLVRAAAAITRGAHLYPAASGEVDDTGTTKIGLVALDAATAQGDLIEAAPCLLGA